MAGEEKAAARLRATVEVTHERSRDRPVETSNNHNNKESSKEEDRTLIEPHYPSIDLFDEEELLEVGEDGILRASTAATTHRQSGRLSYHGSEEEDENRGDQLWLVDEWEEELEGDMDDWMDWVEDHAVSRDVTKDKNRLRDQNAIESILLDEDEASPFQRLFSDSWLF